MSGLLEPQPLRIKVCGLTRLQDAQLAASLGAWALGFVFYAPSPRAVSMEQAADISQQLTAALADQPLQTVQPLKVGVFVNEDPDTILEVAQAVGLSHLQLHGNEPPQRCQQLQAAGYPVIKALRLRTPQDLETARAYQGVEALLLDAAVPGQWGGSGQLADWQLAAQLVQSSALSDMPCILAGGLKPANLLAAQAAVAPWAFDLSSGLESQPGHKDPQLLQALFAVQRPQPESSHERNPDV